MKTYLFIAIIFLSEIISAAGIKQPAVAAPPLKLKAAHGKAMASEAVSSQFDFIENKGQIIDQDNKPNPGCLFLYNGSGLHVQLKQNSFSYEVWKKTERPASAMAMAGKESGVQDSNSMGIHRVDVTFLNANKNPTIIASDIASDYINYYTTGTPETGVTHVRHFKKVLYQNIYQNIDIEFILNDQNQNSNFKYNFTSVALFLV